MARMFGPNTEIQLSEAGDAVKAQPLLRVGKFKHPKHGVVNLTASHMTSFVKNFHDNAKRVKLALDFGHDTGGKAAAWFQDVCFDEPTGVLSVVPEWTPKGAESVKNKDYRYLSVDFDLDYEDNESGKKFGPTLNGAGLTNRPFVKGMETIQLSEGDDQMTLEQALAMIEQLKAQLAQSQNAAQPMQAQLGQMQQQYSEASTKIKDLEGKLSEHAKADALAAKSKTFDTLMAAGKACEAQRAIFLADVFDAVKFAEAFVAPHTIRLSESEKDAADKTQAKADSAEGKILQFADAIVKDKKVDKSTAIGMVLSDPAHKAIVDEYNKHVQF